MESDTGFVGAKLALFLGEELLVIRRDDRPDIPWPDFLDFPGGGREGDEGCAVTTALTQKRCSDVSEAHRVSVG